MTSQLQSNQHELARALFEESGDALFLLDPETDRLIDVNAVVLRLTGFSRPEVLQFPSTYFFRFESAGGHQRLRGAFSKTVVFHSQDGYLLRTKDDNWMPVNLTVSRLHLQPKTLGLIIARDDRERRQALNQARRVESELRTVLSSSPAALWSAERSPGPDVTAGWQFRYFSPLLARIAGRPAEYFEQPFKWAEVVHPSDREAYRLALRRLLTGSGSDTEQQYRVQALDGAVRWVRDRLQVIRDGTGRPQRLDGCVVDVTEQRQAEEAVRQNEQRFRALVEKSRDGILLIDERRCIRYATPACRLVFGYEPSEVIGKDFFDLIQPSARTLARTSLATATSNAGEDVACVLEGAATEGPPRIIDLNICNRLDDPSVRAVVVNYRDVTERNQLEEQLRQSHKLEAVGRLAGGIAHDFNNLLTVILGNLELIRGGFAGDEEEDLLKSTERAARQAADLTKQMLGFARRQPLRTATLDLNSLVQEAINLLRRTIDPRIAIQMKLQSDLRPVAVDPVQIQQVLLNLCLNARDAMPEGGTLTIETLNADVSRPATVEETGSATGFVRVSVADTGIGMTEEVRAKIFEPFFTTKDVGQGTGLGLAVVYGVARAHGGWVECSSLPGAGSRFDVFLPRGVASDDFVEDDRSLAKTLPRGQGETILLADDEPLVRALAKTALERLNYQVIVAADGAEALELFQHQATEIALVVLDVSMPQMSGKQVGVAIRQIAPHTRILFASGHPLSDNDLVDNHSDFLHKPYTPSTLGAAVRKSLDSLHPTDSAHSSA